MKIKIDRIYQIVLALSMVYFLSGCAGSGIMGRGIPVPIPGMCEYHIKSEPPGAQIYFNGKYLGKTPLKWQRFLLLQTIEFSKIEARLEGYENGILIYNIYGNMAPKRVHANINKLEGAKRLISFNLPQTAYSNNLIKDGKAPSIQFVNTRQSVSSEIAYINIKYEDNGYGIGNTHLFINDSEICLDEGLVIQRSENLVIKRYKIKLQHGLNEISVFVLDKNNQNRSELARLSIVGEYSLKTKPVLHAVILGIDDFNNGKHLKNAVADADLFGSTLYRYAKDIFQEIDIHYLRKNHETKKKAIFSSLQQLQSISPNDFFVFFVSSHGAQNNGVFYLACSDGMISQYELLDLFKRIPTSNKLILFDTCFSGMVNTEIAKKLSEDAVKNLNITSVSASQPYQNAFEGYADGHGVFTYVLSEALEGKADFNGDGVIQSMELAYYTQKHVPPVAVKFLKKIQEPASFQYGQVFPITKLKTYRDQVNLSPQYFSKKEVGQLLNSLNTNNVSQYNNLLMTNKINTNDKINLIKDEAEKEESHIVENEFKISGDSYHVDRIKFVFHDDAIFLGITDKLKTHNTFVDDQGHILLYVDVFSKEFTKHSVNNIDTTKVSEIDIGWHGNFYRVTLHLKNESAYFLSQSESGIYIKLSDKEIIN